MGKALFRFFASIKLAVPSILLLAGVLAYATVAESFYGMRGAHLLVYGQWWFAGILFLIGFNVLCAALSRFPWKPRQTGFVITHLGIIILLIGSYITQRWGVDGSLPVIEGSESGAVVMPELVLTLRNEENEVVETVPVPESALRRRGELVSVKLPNGEKIIVKEFRPRVVAEKNIVESPVAGVGAPAVKLEIFNSRFQLSEWLRAEQPLQATEWNLGPAILSFKKLWSPSEEASFLGKRAPEKKENAPFIVVLFEGKQYRVGVPETVRRWTPISTTGLELYTERYLPYAVVEKNELKSRSNEPVNPAVQILVRRSGDKTTEKHTLFAFYPEFNTLHRKPGAAAMPAPELGVQFQMVMPAQQNATGRGRLELALGSDDKTLYYRSSGANGDLKNQGSTTAGEEVALGWMDLKFKAETILSHSLESIEPRYVERIEGTDGNFLSSVEIARIGARTVSSDEAVNSRWLIEGAGETLPVGNEIWSIQYGRRTLQLPFQIFLSKFTVGNDPGTTKAASYESDVRVRVSANEMTKDTFKISMNEPLKHGGYTFYQASYQMEEGKPPVSVFSVNYDPGRSVKYLGSIVMVLGILLMFYLNPHYWDKMLGRSK